MKEPIKNKKEMKRIRTYIEGLDENIEGGVPEGQVVLVCGTAGTMKSSLTFNILYNEVMNGKIGLYLSLEQSYTSLMNHMMNMGYDMDKIKTIVLSDISKLNSTIADVKSSKKGVLVISDLGSIRKQVTGTSIGPSGDWLNAIKNIIKKLKASAGCDLCVLDSLSALTVLSDFAKPRHTLFYIFEFLRDTGLTSFVVTEVPMGKGGFTEHGVESYLSDAIIMLRLTERERKVTREISVMKMRATDCNTDVYTLEYKNRKFKALYGGKPPLL